MFQEKINLRPMVLGICFLWGLCCGFLFYMIYGTSETVETPTPPKPPAVTQIKTPPEVGSKATTQTAKKEETTSHPTPPPIAIKTNVDDVRIPPQDTQPSGRVPVPPVALVTTWGLNGANARLPASPIEESTRPTHKKPPTPVAPINLAPPELDF